MIFMARGIVLVLVLIALLHFANEKSPYGRTNLPAINSVRSLLINPC